MLSKDEAKRILEKVTAASKFYAVATIGAGKQATTRFANSQISQNVQITDTNLILRLFDGKKSANCSTNVLTEAGIEALARDTENMLSVVPEGEFEAFPFSIAPVKESIPDGVLAGTFNSEGRAAFVKEGVSKVKQNFTVAGALNFNQNVVAIKSSSGGFRYTAYDFVDFNTVVTHDDGAAGSGAVFSYIDVPDIAAQFEKAQATAEAAKGAISPELGAYTVVLSPSAFGTLVSYLGYMLNAKAVHDGMSFAAGKLGEKLFGENFTLNDVPGHPLLSPLLFDTEGTPRQAVTLIEKGVVKSFLYDNAMAKRHNTASTGHAVGFGMGGYPGHMVIDGNPGGNMTLVDIIKDTENGVLINDFHYTNFVNPRNLQLTGLTRNGTFLIKNGELSSPISTVRFTESLLNAFKNITAISATPEQISGGMLAPAVRIEDFHFTSKA